MRRSAPTGAGSLQGGSSGGGQHLPNGGHHHHHHHHHHRIKSLGGLLALVAMTAYVSTNFKVHGGIASSGGLEGGGLDIHGDGGVMVQGGEGGGYRVLTAVNSQGGHRAPVLTKGGLRGVVLPEGEEEEPAAGGGDDTKRRGQEEEEEEEEEGSRRPAPPAAASAASRREEAGGRGEGGECWQLVDRRWKRVHCGGDQHHMLYDNKKGGGEDDDVRWCRQVHHRDGVQVGRSWGRLNGPGRERWETVGCNGVITLGRKQTCDEISGLRFLEDWRGRTRVVMGQSLTTTESSTDSGGGGGGGGGTSRVVCASNYVESEACVMENVMLDFSKAQPMGGTRDAHQGFVVLEGEWTGKVPNFPPGITTVPPPKDANNNQRLPFENQCSRWVSSPTMVMSHDDIFNYGHSLADFWTVWIMGELFRLTFRDMNLVNMDGIRGNGPAGNHNKLMVRDQADHLSPFFDLYRSWFRQQGDEGEEGQAGVMKAIDFGREKVCFKKLLFQPEPGVAHIWSDFSRVSQCSLQGPSWLYQEYNRHVRRHLFGHETYMQAPRPSRPQVTFLVRKMKLGGGGATRKVGSSRIVANEEELLSSLRAIEGVDVVALDFSTIPFAQQMHVIQNTSVLLGFHGAGMAHILSLPVGVSQCCGVVEMTVEGFHDLNQFGNQARQLGMTFHRWESRDRSKTSDAGTVVDVQAVTALVRKAVASLPP